jgi:hypothetical protein
MKTISSRIFAVTSAVALALLFAVANATALTNSTPVNAAASVAKSLTAKTALTPAVAGSSPVSESVAEDIRDIRQPRHVPAPWFWVVVAAGVAICLAAAVAVWAALRRNRIFQLSPTEIALQHLEEARRLIDPAHAREYCFAVSSIIRGYLEKQLRLRAPRLTTEEFLRELVEGPERIAGEQRALLGDFLGHCDLAKFAGWYYSRAALSDMHKIAVEFVQQTCATQTVSARNNHAKVLTAPELTLVNKK